MLLLNIPLPTWLVILFFVVLLAASFVTGRWLERNDDSQRFENWPDKEK